MSAFDIERRAFKATNGLIRTNIRIWNFFFLSACLSAIDLKSFRLSVSRFPPAKGDYFWFQICG